MKGKMVKSQAKAKGKKAGAEKLARAPTFSANEAKARPKDSEMA